MEYVAEITRFVKIKDKLLLKYFFRDKQTGKEDWFLSDRKIGCVFNLVGKLILRESDEHPKFYQSFKQNINNLTDEEEERFFKSEDETRQEIEEVKNDPTKKEKRPLTVRQVICLEEEDWTQKEIGEFAGGYTDRMVRYWKKEGDKPKLKKKRGPKFKMNKKLQIILELYLLDNPKSFQRETVKYFKEEYGVELHRTTVSRATKEIKFRRKKISYRYSKQKELLPQFWDFVKRMKPLLNSPYLLAFDESGFPLNMAPTWGYGLIGDRINENKPGWGENCSLLLLIQNVKDKGIIHWKLVRGTVDTLVFHNFFKEVILPTNNEYCLLIDNAPFHNKLPKKYKIGKEEIILPPISEYLASKNIKVEFITPYFPQLNPVEELFGIIKGYIDKCEPRTYEELKANISKIIGMLQGQDMTKLFRDCLDYDFILESIESGN